MSAPHFDGTYSETVLLSDHSPVVLRSVRPTDKALLREGLLRMSPASRYRRFLAPKNQLSDAELKYLTETDGHDHYAIGAVASGPGNAEEGIGVARFIRSKSDPEAAEVAIAVVDHWQGKGVGSLLLLRLAAAARERKVLRFQGKVLAENYPVRELLRQLGPAVSTRASGQELVVEIDVPDVPPDAGLGFLQARAPLRRLFSLAASHEIFDQAAERDAKASPCA